MNNLRIANELTRLAKALMATNGPKEIASLDFKHSQGDYYRVRLTIRGVYLYAEFTYKRTHMLMGDSRGRSEVRIGLFLDVKPGDVIRVCQKNAELDGYGGLVFGDNWNEGSLEKIMLVERDIFSETHN